ncbi:MAG: ribose-5-phosphate isomerase RpiA [Rhizobiales bacterium]|nr:ribose-5-phosphate isomerase RpiA [Hyphomicrobiales bacterium]
MEVNLKRAAAEAAMAWIKPGMKLGLGTGSTANELVHLIGDAVADGLDIVCVPTSKATEMLAAGRNIPLATLDQEPALDLTIDGADEIGPGLGLIKGGGGAHLREKIVARASKSMLVIADQSKVVETLGAFPLPLEVVSFGLAATMRALETVFSAQGLSGGLTVRGGRETPFLTDSGNIVLDASLGRIEDPERLVAGLCSVPGLVEHGLFLNIATAAVVAHADRVETLYPLSSS